MADAPMRVLVYSDDRQIRATVRAALGRKPAPELPEIEIVECATEPVVIREMDTNSVDVVILDGEAAPAGGMGVCRQLKDEIYHCPPVLVLIAREQDAWLATWSRADAVSPHPVDAFHLANAVADLMRQRIASAPVRS